LIQADSVVRKRSLRAWRKGVTRTVLALLAITLAVLASFQKPAKYFPHVVVETVGTLQVHFLQQGHPTLVQCETAVKRIVDTVRKNCVECKPLTQSCPGQLSSRQHRMLAGLPIDTPVMRIPNGVVEFRSQEPETAYLACLESQRQTSRTVSDIWSCAAPDTQKLDLSFVAPSGAGPSAWTSPSSLFLVALVPIGAIICFLVCYFIVRFERLHARFSHDSTTGGPQKFHAMPTPRIGGVAIASGMAGSVASLWLWAGGTTVSSALAMLMLSALPAFAGGLGEDLTRQVGVLARLMLTMAAGVIASLLVGATLERLDIAGFDRMLEWSVFAIAFTAFAVGGVANAVNIIDGYNGLVGAYLMIVLVAIAWVASQVGDSFVLAATLTGLGAILGFLVWNWPKGVVFLGDGGAYLLGFWIAELSVLLVVRNLEVSPWFPLALLAYPIFETLFSIYRRSVVRGESSGRPDAMHFHTLVFRRLVRTIGAKDVRAITRSNSTVAPYMLAFSLTSILPALLLWENSFWLMIVTLTFCMLYVFAYSSIVRFRTPAWAIRR